MDWHCFDAYPDPEVDAASDVGKSGKKFDFYSQQMSVYIAF